MKNICFIGAFDKLDLILYVSKIIKSLGKKVLIIDATELQRGKYIVPITIIIAIIVIIMVAVYLEK